MNISLPELLKAADKAESIGGIRVFNGTQCVYDSGQIKTLMTSLQKAMATVRHYSCLNCQNGEMPCYDYTSCKALREIKKEIEGV